VSIMADESSGIVTGGATAGGTAAAESVAAVAASSFDETVQAEIAEMVRSREIRGNRIVKALVGSAPC
jgi:hypothetical protein